MKNSVFIILASMSPFLSAHAPQDPSFYQKELESFVYGEVDYLLLFTHQDGLLSPTDATGKSPNLSSPWSSGVRASVGFQPSDWDTRLSYSYYATSSHDKVTADIETILTSYPSTAGIFEVEEKWGLHFHRLDLELARKILLGRHCLLQPFVGLQWLDVHQKFDQSTSTAFLDLDTGLPATDVVESENRNTFLSLGAKAGFKANCYLGKGFDFYGNFGAGILSGKFNIKQEYEQIDDYSSATPLVLVDQTKHVFQNGSIFNCDVEIGFGWRHHFKKSNLELLIKTGWEQHYFADIVRFENFYLQQTTLGTASYSTHGNLTLAGFTFGILLRY